MAEDNNLKIADPAVETNSSEIKSSSNAENEFYTVSKKWRKQLNNLQAQLVNPRDYTELERDARVLDKCMRELAAAQEALENTQSSTVEKMALYGKFEEMSRETNHVLVQVGQTVRELNQNENEDKQSVRSSRSSRSEATSKSKHSKSTRSSLANSSSSARLRRLERRNCNPEGQDELGTRERRSRQG
jgi:vacuolar-type H+-ATPase subunit I/STV1